MPVEKKVEKVFRFRGGKYALTFVEQNCSGERQLSPAKGETGKAKVSGCALISKLARKKRFTQSLPARFLIIA